jgi:hypothetical protein
LKGTIAVAARYGRRWQREGGSKKNSKISGIVLHFASDAPHDTQLVGLVGLKKIPWHGR